MAKPAPGQIEHRFGPFTYDPAQRILFRAGEPVPLVPKLADTLHVLLERRGTVVEKSELMRLVWPDAVVEESGLARNISLLRKALGDESEEFIQTVPKRGYRFAAAEPDPSPSGTRRRSWAKWVLAGGSVAAVLLGVVYWQFFRPGRLLSNDPRVEIAVLPFQPLAPAPSAISQSLDESLVIALAQVPSVRLVSPSTLRRYRAAKVPSHLMARILGMDAVLEGTVEVDPGQVRVTARLVDVHSGRIIWANRYDRSSAAGEPVQVSIAKSIAADVEPHLSLQRAFRPMHADR